MAVTGAPARLGLYINNRAAVFLGDGYGMDGLIRAARRADEAGLDFVAVGDSVLAKPRYSPLVVLAGVAACTTRIELSTGILQPHLRNPVLLAQEWATLDVLSAGRTSLAVGLGTGPKDMVDAELALVGLTRANRARAFEESITALRQLWKGGPVSLQGVAWDLRGADPGFVPFRRGGPPILIACGAYIPKQRGFGPNDVYRPDIADSFIGPFDRVARLGDGWMTGMAKPGEYRALWHRILREAEAVGRIIDEATFERRLNCFIHVDGDAKRARAEGTAFLQAYHRLPMDEDTVDRWLIAGPPQSCAQQLNEYVEAGVTSFQLVLASDRQFEQLERVAADVRPLLAPQPAPVTVQSGSETA